MYDWNRGSQYRYGPARDMRGNARGDRAAPAQRSKLVTLGASVTVLVGMVGGMALHADQAAAASNGIAPSQPNGTLSSNRSQSGALAPSRGITLQRLGITRSGGSR